MALDDFYREQSPQEQTNTQTPALPAKTGVDFWDKKQEITPYEAYLAKKYNGVSFEGKLDIRTMSATNTLKDIANLDQGIKNTSDYVGLIGDNAGFWSGLGRRLNKASGGIIPISSESAQYGARRQQNIGDTAQALAGGGKPTNAALERSDQIAGGDFQSPKEAYHRMSQVFDVQANALESKFTEALTKNLPTPYLEWIAMRAQDTRRKSDYLKNIKSASDFNYSEFLGEKKPSNPTNTIQRYGGN